MIMKMNNVPLESLNGNAATLCSYIAAGISPEIDLKRREHDMKISFFKIEKKKV